MCQLIYSFPGDSQYKFQTKKKPQMKTFPLTIMGLKKTRSRVQDPLGACVTYQLIQSIHIFAPTTTIKP